MPEQLAASTSNESLERGVTGGLQQTLEYINTVLPKRPDMASFFRDHPQCTNETLTFLKGLGIDLDSQDANRIQSLLSTIDHYKNNPDLHSIVKQLETVAEMYQDYIDAVQAYEDAEDRAYQQLKVNGEHFKSRDINRLIRKLCVAWPNGSSDWTDPAEFDEEILTFNVFDNEWQRFYQVIRNEDPDTTLGWRRKISEDILSIFSSNELDAVPDDDERADNKADTVAYHDYFDDATSTLVEYDRESIYTEIDRYFDVDNLDQRFIVTTIDLLFQAQEFEKEHIEEAFAVDPSLHNIDWYYEEAEWEQTAHECRDLTYKEILRSYIEERLEPRLNTVFNKLKYQSVMDAWNNHDTDYTDYSEIVLPIELHEKFCRESNKNKADTHYRENIQVCDELLLAISKDSYGEYIGNDIFRPLIQTSDGQYKLTSVLVLLEKNGLKGHPLTNDGIGEYRSLVDLRVLASLKETFGIEIRDLTIKEQYYFLGYLQRVTPDSAERMRQFTACYGVTGMRTFLSLERGDASFGDRIVAFGQHEEAARGVFDSYAGLLDAANELEAYITSELDCGRVDCESIIAVARNRLIGEAYTYLHSTIESGDTENIPLIEESIRESKKLSAAFQASIAAETVGTVEAFRSFRNEVIPANEVVHASLADTLVEIYRKNYQLYGYDSHSIDELVDDFQQKLMDEQSRLYVRSVGDNVLAFSLVTDDPEARSSYISGLNANPELKGTKQGLTTLGQIVTDNVERGWITTAEASPQNFRGYSALDQGWVATAVKTDNLKEEAYMLEIAVFPSHHFASKELTTEAIIKKALQPSQTETQEEYMLFWNTDDPAATPELQRDGKQFVISRSLQVEHEGKTTYIFVLEPTPPKNTATVPQTQIAA